MTTMLRGILPVLVVSATAFAGAARADATCGGNACGVVALSADGCQWTNKGDKSVRLSLVTDGVSRLVTVLAPRESYREPNKNFCAASAGGSYSATFATLAVMPPESAPKPAAKPAIIAAPKPAPVPAAPAAVAPPASGEVAVVSVGSTVPLPRTKPKLPPAYPPLPRAKPEAPAVVAAAPSVVAPAVAPTNMVAPTAAVQPAVNAAPCGDTCPPILFKVIDGCLWVLNLNPKAVAFRAEVAGQLISVVLEAADGAKADARAAAIAAGTVIKDESAVHMRLRDPFQSAGSGIPVFRAKLMASGACLKSRDQMGQFQASYVR